MDRRVTPAKRVTSPFWVPHLHVNRPLVVTRFMAEMSYVFLFALFFFTAAHFRLGGRWHFSFSHRRYKILIIFFQQKNVLLCFIRLALALCRSFSLVELR